LCCYWADERRPSSFAGYLLVKPPPTPPRRRRDAAADAAATPPRPIVSASLARLSKPEMASPASAASTPTLIWDFDDSLIQCNSD
jgi:pyridoxal phosphate phosphatase PHOSPHO2